MSGFESVNFRLISLDITGFLMLWILSMYQYFRDIWFSAKISKYNLALC